MERQTDSKSDKLLEMLKNKLLSCGYVHKGIEMKVTVYFNKKNGNQDKYQTIDDVVN